MRRVWTWEHPVPPRFSLVDEYGDDADVPVAACADLVGLFADRPPPAPERYTLLGCQPDGALRAAPARLGTDDAWLGDVRVQPDHGADRPRGCRPWDDHHCDCGVDLVDVRVVGSRPSGVGAGLWDIDLDGRPCPDERVPAQAPPARGFRLDGSDEPYGVCRAAAGVYRERPAPPRHPLTLVGCELTPTLSATMTPCGGRGHRHASIKTVDRTGQEFDLPLTATICLGDGDVHPSVLGPGLVDIRFGACLIGTMPAAARSIWDLWFTGGPTGRNRWAAYDRELRHWWAGAALVHGRRQIPDSPPGGTYHLDGRHVTDREGFFCALGEAVNGPGGYFGWNLDAVDDCLRGGFGAAPPFHLVWHDSDVARRHLVSRRHGGAAFDDLLHLLRAGGATVELR